MLLLCVCIHLLKLGTSTSDVVSEADDKLSEPMPTTATTSTALGDDNSDHEQSNKQEEADADASVAEPTTIDLTIEYDFGRYFDLLNRTLELLVALAV